MPRRASAASAQALSMLFGTDETESAAQRAADAEAAHAAAAAAAAAGVMLDAIMPAEDVADVRNEPRPPAPQPAAAAVQPSKEKAREAERAGPRAKRKAPAAAISKQQPKQARKIVVVESNGTEMFQELRRLAPMGGHVEASGSEPLELKSYARRLMKAMSAPGAMRLYADWKRSAP